MNLLRKALEHLARLERMKGVDAQETVVYRSQLWKAISPHFTKLFGLDTMSSRDVSPHLEEEPVKVAKKIVNNYLSQPRKDYTAHPLDRDYARALSSAFKLHPDYVHRDTTNNLDQAYGGTSEEFAHLSGDHTVTLSHRPPPDPNARDAMGQPLKVETTGRVDPKYQGPTLKETMRRQGHPPSLET